MVKPIRDFAAILLLITCPVANATDEHGPTHNLVSLQAEASDAVENDTLVAALSAHAEGTQAADLADQVNRQINWAIALVKKTPGVSVATQRYQTSPIYTKNTRTGWRISQTLRLENQDAAQMSGLLAELQARLQIDALDFQVSEGARHSAQDRLITQAIERFKTRAKRITNDLDRHDYRLVRMEVNTGYLVPQPRPMMRTLARNAQEAVAAPTLETGRQRVTVTVSGTIEVTED